MASLLERFINSPLARQFEAEEAAEAVDKRRAAVAEIERLEAERTKTVPALQAKEAAAADEVARAQRALDVAKNALATASLARYRVNSRLDVDVTQQQVILRTTAPAEIATWRDEICDRERHIHCANFDDAELTGGEGLPDYDGRRRRAAENAAAESRQRRMYVEGLVNQRRVLEELVYVSLSPDALAAKLEVMRNEMKGLAAAAGVTYAPGWEN